MRREEKDGKGEIEVVECPGAQLLSRARACVLFRVCKRDMIVLGLLVF